MQKRSRKLSKKEVAALAVLVVALALGLGIRQWYLQQRDADRAAFEQEQKQVFSMGDAVALDSVEDKSAVNTESAFDTEGVPYAAFFPWDGTMEVTVQSAQLYDTPSAAGVDDADLTLKTDPAPLFLLVELTVKNIDAKPILAHSGKEWFNISFVKLPPQGDTPYFDGTPPGADASEGFYFDLGQGLEETYRLGWFVDPNDSGHPSDTLTFGGGPDKYTVKLEVEDMRGGDAV